MGIAHRLVVAFDHDALDSITLADVDDDTDAFVMVYTFGSVTPT